MSEEIKKTVAEADAQNVPAVIQTDDEDSAAEMMLAAGRFEKFDITADLQSESAAYCSMVAVDNKARVTLYNACNQPAKLAEHINETIKVLHIYAEIIPVTNKLTGAIDKAPRVVLIDEKGQGYQAVSIGIYNAVKQLMHMFGDPSTWTGPHTVKVINVPLEGGQHTFSLKMVD